MCSSQVRCADLKLGNRRAQYCTCGLYQQTVWLKRISWISAPRVLLSRRSIDSALWILIFVFVFLRVYLRLIQWLFFLMSSSSHFFLSAFHDVSILTFLHVLYLFPSLFLSFYHSLKHSGSEACWVAQREFSRTTEVQCYPFPSLKFPPCFSFLFFPSVFSPVVSNISILIERASPFLALKREPLSFITANCECGTSFRPHYWPLQGPVFTRAPPGRTPSLLSQAFEEMIKMPV